jgi:hypothetical protein
MVSFASTMAIWQFDIAFFPRCGPTPWRTADGFEIPSLEPSKVVKAQAWLQARYGDPWEMLEDWFVFGSEYSHRVDLLFNKNGTGQISARMDAQSESAIQFARQLCELSSLLDCGLFSIEMWKSLEPSPAALCLALERSRAAAFIRNPEKLIRGADGGD